MNKKIRKGLLIFVGTMLLIFAIRVARDVYYDTETTTAASYSISGESELVLRNRVDLLDTYEKKKTFLERIVSTDQQVRSEEGTALQTHGMNSGEHLLAERAADSTDQHNLYATKYFLETYGYPQSRDPADKLTKKILLIFHHKASLREFSTYYPYFRKAYDAGELSADDLFFTLRRFYTIEKTREMIKDGVPYRSEDYIEKLEKRLNLI